MYLSQKQNCEYWYLQREEPGQRKQKAQTKIEKKKGKGGEDRKVVCPTQSVQVEKVVQESFTGMCKHGTKNVITR